MTLDGHIGRLSTKRVEVAAAGGHPAVTLTGLVKAGQGMWEPGTILTRDNDELTPWDGSGDPVGVLRDRVDSDIQTSANYVAHGSVVLAYLKKANGDPPSETEIFALNKAGLFGA